MTGKGSEEAKNVKTKGDGVEKGQDQVEGKGGSARDKNT